MAFSNPVDCIGIVLFCFVNVAGIPEGNVLTLDGNAKDRMYHSDEDIIYNLDKNRFAAQTDKQTRDFEVRSRGSTFTFFCGTIYVLRKAVQHY